jgi:phosphate starvation-inducible PhoH-like protein
VVTGDVTQVDLPSQSKSGLAEAKALLSGISGISFCTLTDVDVVRHPLVQKIIVAYEERDKNKKAAEERVTGPRSSEERSTGQDK